MSYIHTYKTRVLRNCRFQLWSLPSLLSNPRLRLELLVDGVISMGGSRNNGCQPDGVFGSNCAKPEKLIIDTDPGIGEFPGFNFPSVFFFP